MVHRPVQRSGPPQRRGHPRGEEDGRPPRHHRPRQTDSLRRGCARPVDDHVRVGAPVRDGRAVLPPQPERRRAGPVRHGRASHPLSQLEGMGGRPDHRGLVRPVQDQEREQRVRSDLQLDAQPVVPVQRRHGRGGDLLRRRVVGPASRHQGAGEDQRLPVLPVGHRETPIGRFEPERRCNPPVRHARPAVEPPGRCTADLRPQRGGGHPRQQQQRRQRQRERHRSVRSGARSRRRRRSGSQLRRRRQAAHGWDHARGR
mmetsp:Transcript_18900/g.43825  ORF Transcript_18900/g.43825 Transcript_18900/m.43825 type:complete len:258 (+) Transcript_18900:684-1457(+)